MPTAWVEPADVGLNDGWKNTNLISLVSALQAWFGNIDGIDFTWTNGLVMYGDVDGCGQSLYNVKKWFGPAAGNVQVRDASGFGISPSATGTQNATALQAAIDDLPNGIGGCVIVPPGVYTINPGIYMSGSTYSTKTIPNVTLMGFGDCTTLKLATNTGESIFIDMRSQANMTIRDLCYDGNGSLQGTTSSFLSADATTNGKLINVTVKNIVFTGGGSPGAAGIGAGSSDFVISDCRFSYEGRITGSGSQTPSASHVLIEDSFFSIPSTANGDGAIFPYQSRGWIVSGCIFAGTDTVTTNRCAVYAGAGTYYSPALFALTGNAFDRCGKVVKLYVATADALKPTINQFSISGNSMRKSLTAGVWLEAGGNYAGYLPMNYNLVFGNSLSKNGNYGIGSPVAAQVAEKAASSYSSIFGDVVINHAIAGIGFDGNDAYATEASAVNNTIMGNACGDTRSAGASQDHGISLDGSKFNVAYAACISDNMVLANACSENTVSDYEDTGVDNVLAHNQET